MFFLSSLFAISKFSATVEAAENFTGSFQILRLSQKLAMLRKLRQKTTSKLAFKHVHSVKDATTIMAATQPLDIPWTHLYWSERNPTNFLFSSLFICGLCYFCSFSGAAGPWWPDPWSKRQEWLHYFWKILIISF